MIPLPRLFVGSASETEHIARAIAAGLAGKVVIHLWSEVFELGELNLQALQREAAECDFAIFVWGVEDTTVSRGKRSGSPRDNVVYEAGLFAGALGGDRVFVAHARDTRIPSDYLGITTAAFDPAAPDIDGIMRRILRRVERLGPRPATIMSGNWWQVVVTPDDSAVVSFLTVTPLADGRTVKMGGPAWDENARPVARWDSLATWFDEDERVLHYSWSGRHRLEPGIPEFFGTGMIRYGGSPVTGDYASVPRHGGGPDARVRWKSAYYYRAEPEQLPVMAADDRGARKNLIRLMLERRDLDD